MAAIIERSPLYENGRLYLDSTGNVILEEDDTKSEVLSRLNALRGTNPFNTDYGSYLTGVINKRTISANQINLWVREALAPMIQLGKITSDIIVLPVIRDYKISLSVTVTNASGKTINAIFESYLVN